VEGALIGAIALTLGGTATTGFCVWDSIRSNDDEGKLWRISNAIERWIYGIGGVISAAIGAIILTDQFA